MSVTAIIIGGGSRGSTYAYYSKEHPDDFQIIGIAEPRAHVRDRLCQHYNISPSKTFKDWSEVFAVPKFADCVIITTPDRLHKDPALAAAEKGYHILLEKPVAPNRTDCEAIYNACKACGVMVAVCHVLRYQEQAVVAKELIDKGVIGNLVNIQLIEPVGFYHFAHSYVRGNWRREATSAPSLLAKSCHDLDLIQYWMGDARCIKVSSFGSLSHFRIEDKPDGATECCLDCPVEKNCPYSAKKIYLDRAKRGHWGWPVSVVTEGHRDIEDLTTRLRSGSYGKCVYLSDNDVCSNQVVNLEYEGGKTASFSMIAFTEKTCVRQVRIHGTKGQLEFDMDFRSPVRQFDFLQRTTFLHEKPSEAAFSRLGGHGGADFCMMRSFVNAIKNKNSSLILTGLQESLSSHQLVFAAEEARHTESVIRLAPIGVDGMQVAVVPQAKVLA